MLQKLRQRYPQVALISELVQIDHGKYIVRAIIEIEGKTVVTGLAAADTVEIAEDRARERALLLLEAENTPDLQLVEKVSPNNISLPSDLPKPVASAKKSTKRLKSLKYLVLKLKLNRNYPKLRIFPRLKLNWKYPKLRIFPRLKLNRNYPKLRIFLYQNQSLYY